LGGVNRPQALRVSARDGNRTDTGCPQVGAHSRRLHERLRRLQYTPFKRFLLARTINLFDLGRMIWYTARLGRTVRTKFGIPVAAQWRAQWNLTFRQNIEPTIYYLNALYQPGALDRIAAYFTRREVKGLVLEFMHRLQPPAAERRINLGDKLQVAAWCARAALPHPAPLMLIEDGQVVWQSGNLLDLDQDLFVKPRRGRGAAGVRAFRRTAAFQYMDGNGRSLKLGELVSGLIRVFGTRNLIVQPRLRNHPDLGDLATASLAVVRAVTCLDERQQPELVVAYFRILAKLEPDWPVKWPISEYAAAVDLDTGRLSQLTGDKPECLSDWYDRHPVTHAEITGRVLPHWKSLAELACRAHRLFHDRILIGWDIAITPSGPVILEGNSYPDTHYPQRIHRRPYGEMRLGELLEHHMTRLDARLDAGQVRRR
jgi:hypothetical protein